MRNVTARTVHERGWYKLTEMRSRSLLAIILFALLCGGCSTPVEPTDPIAPSRLEINPEVVSVDPGEDLELRAVLDTSGPNAFAWSFDGGSLIANGADAIWSAPVEPGPYQVSVSVPGTALSATSSV